MNNYDYSPEELKIIMDIANKHKITISLGENSITIHSQQDLKPLMVFSTSGFNIQINPNLNNIDYRREISDISKIFMQEQVTIKS